MAKTKFTKWEDYFKFKGLDPKNLPDVSMVLPESRKRIIANYILEIIIGVENDSKEGDIFPDYTDRNQRKYEPWLEVIANEKNPTGVGLAYGDCDDWYTATAVGVRLVTRNPETCKAVFEQFKSLYEDLYL